MDAKTKSALQALADGGEAARETSEGGLRVYGPLGEKNDKIPIDLSRSQRIELMARGLIGFNLEITDKGRKALA